VQRSARVVVCGVWVGAAAQHELEHGRLAREGQIAELGGGGGLWA